MSPFSTCGPWAIILAAGAGSRLASACSVPKQFIIWNDVPLYWHSVETFSRCPFICGLVLVFPPDLCGREENRIRVLSESSNAGLPLKIAAGGKTRSESAANGLREVPMNCELVFIHDAARPFFSSGLVFRLREAMQDDEAGVIPAIKPADTIKIAYDGLVSATLPREHLRAVQTPQLFRTDVLRKANLVGTQNNWQVTDDASLVERLGGKVRVIEGEDANLKITRPADLVLLEDKTEMWIPANGFGYDAHRFGPGRPFRLGGVQIPSAPQIIAHSDGDVLLHALMDALLGAAALGDIGKLFPPDDPAYEAISSSILLDHCLSLFQEAGMILCQVDLVVVAQKPRLTPWKGEIVRNVARLLSLEESRVGLKATTEEGMGYTGRMEGIKAYALVSALRKGKVPQSLKGWAYKGR